MRQWRCVWVLAACVCAVMMTGCWLDGDDSHSSRAAVQPDVTTPPPVTPPPETPPGTDDLSGGILPPTDPTDGTPSGGEPPTGGGTDPNLDDDCNPGREGVVPEPATIALFTCAGAAAALLRRRHTRKA